MADRARGMWKRLGLFAGLVGVFLVQFSGAVNAEEDALVPRTPGYTCIPCLGSLFFGKRKFECPTSNPTMNCPKMAAVADDLYLLVNIVSNPFSYFSDFESTRRTLWDESEQSSRERNRRFKAAGVDGAARFRRIGVALRAGDELFADVPPHERDKAADRVDAAADYLECVHQSSWEDYRSWSSERWVFFNTEEGQRRLWQESRGNPDLGERNYLACPGGKMLAYSAATNYMASNEPPACAHLKTPADAMTLLRALSYQSCNKF